MKRIGHERSPNRATNPTSWPGVIAPTDTRQAPTAMSSALPRAGSESSPASKVARTLPAATRSRRSSSARSASRAASASSRPSVFTTSAPSIDSCATAETSPIRSCARSVGPSTFLAKDRFITASDGNSSPPTSASHGSASRSAIIAKIGQRDDAAGERDRPEHVDRRLDVGLHVREQLPGRRLAVVLELELAVAVGHAAPERRHDPLAGDPAVVTADHDADRAERPERARARSPRARSRPRPPVR